MRKIKIRAEYECFPLWIKNDHGVYENISTETLNLSESLSERIKMWSKKFDSTLNTEYPPNSGFRDLNDAKKFEKEGLEIWRELVSNLGENYKISYFSFLFNKLFDDLNDYKE